MEEHLKKIHTAVTEIWKIYKAALTQIEQDGRLSDAGYDKLVEDTKKAWEDSEQNRYVEDMILATILAVERMDMR